MAVDPFYDIDPTDLARLMSEPIRNYAIFNAADGPGATNPIAVVVGTWQQANARLAQERADALASGDTSRVIPMVIRTITDEQLAAWNG